MKLRNYAGPVMVILMLLFTGMPASYALPPDDTPWSQEQLLAPATLANWLKDATKESLVIFNIGPVGDIPGSRSIGAVEDPKNLSELKAALAPLDRSDTVVIYCGCCPFTHCPNVRPAFRLLEEMGFTNGLLLNLSHNLKQDWIDKGYPMEAEE